jgi:hypothetical protein
LLGDGIETATLTIKCVAGIIAAFLYEISRNGMINVPDVRMTVCHAELDLSNTDGTNRHTSLRRRDSAAKIAERTLKDPRHTGNFPKVTTRSKSLTRGVPVLSEGVVVMSPVRHDFKDH